jgi:hypothetical protein
MWGAGMGVVGDRWSVMGQSGMEQRSVAPDRIVC